MKDNELIFGIRPVLEALKARREIEKLIIQTGLTSSPLKEIIALASSQEIPLSFAPRQKLNMIFSGPHQGVLCLLPAVHYADLDNLIAKAYQEARAPFFLLLDRITDLGNLGAVARTAECAGLDALIISSKGSAPLNGRAVKSSAGALNHLAVCRTSSLQKTLSRLKDSGLKIVACTEKGGKNLYETDLLGPLAILVGSEEDGISSTLLDLADVQVFIPQYGQIQSLNVSVAAGIALYEAIRQRRHSSLGTS